MTRPAPREEIVLEMRLHVPPGTGLPTAIAEIAALPASSPVRQECEAIIYMMLARAAWADADRLRGYERDRAARRRRRKTD